MTSFVDDLAKARHERVPVMALRPDTIDNPDDDPMIMDDIVVKDVETFRMEAMAEDAFWLACYFPNGEQVVFWATAYHEKGKRKAKLRVSCTEMPSEWIDLDKRT